jgi:hypothetical protein
LLPDHHQFDTSFIFSNSSSILYIPLLSIPCCADLRSFAECSAYFFQFGLRPHLVFSTIEILQFKLQNMISPLSALLFGVALASPVVQVRTVTSLNQAAFEEAQQRDATATRAFSSTAIKVRHLSSRTDSS